MEDRSNYTPLTPQSFLRRSVRTYPESTAVIYGDLKFTYTQFYERVCRQANALMSLGLNSGDCVAVLVPNIPAHLEANFGVHMAGCVLVAINTRLSPNEIAFILNHSESKALIVDADLLNSLEPVADQVSAIEHTIVVHDVGGGWEPLNTIDYEEFLARSDKNDPRLFPEDENDLISINYTSGTTGNPKGVMYTHRSAYLNAVCNTIEMRMGHESVYLWTLPMFHCNGWCYTWGVTAVGGTHVCLRNVAPLEVVKAIQKENVSHFCGAPIVLRMVADGALELGVIKFDHGVRVSTAAAPPSPAVIQAMLELNVDVTHVYGLTETYGPTSVCELQASWIELEMEKKTNLMARQGVPYILAEDLQVLDKNDIPVAADGQTLGEVCMKGNIVAKGYFKNPEATQEAFRNGWFHSGDLGVMHPDGYIELKDRAKDIIISGGENISTIEVENVLYSHPDITDVAIVSKPDEKWGEIPVAFITPRDGSDLKAATVIEYCRQRLAHFKAPKEVYFEELPRTSTGKVQKFVLRDRFWKDQNKKIGG